jgi:poly(A) polymerase
VLPLDAAADPALHIVRTLRQHGHSAFLVGGCVRDLLLERPPKDYDVATSARPEQVAALFPHAERVGAHFGVMMAGPVEVATYRTESSYRDGRHPDAVQFETDPARDAVRRDFTINSLFLDPESGQILDFTGGRDDLQRGIIRAIGNPTARFQEDHLRLLRAVRFAARFRFTLDPRTESAIRNLARLSRQVAAERTRDELNRILTEGNARGGFELLHQTGLLAMLLPEVLAMDGVPQPPQFHPEGDVWTHVRIMLELLDQLPASQRTITLAWGILLHDIAKPVTFKVTDRIRFSGHDSKGAVMAAGILTRLKFPSADIDWIRTLVADHMKFNSVRQMREATLKRWIRQERFPELLELHRIDCTSSHRRLDQYEFLRDRLNESAPNDLRPARLVTGDDLIALGFPAGPELGSALRKIEDAQLEGRISTRDEALTFAARQRPS